MAFQLRPNESVAHGLRRLTRKELKRAAHDLEQATPPTEQAIHEARRSLKKARAILKLIKADHGTGTENCRKRIRRVNRTLSGLRDADAMIEILAKLRERDPRLLDEHTFVRIRSHLTTRKQTILESVQRDGKWKNVIQELQAVRGDAKRWHPAHDGFGGLSHGIRSTHRHGRRALLKAKATGRADDFHEWRKQVKALYYQLRLAGGTASALEHDVKALREAETALGDDHNLVLLCAELGDQRFLIAANPGLDRIRRVIDRFQRELRRQAVKAATPIYRITPRDYVRAVKRAWQAMRATSATPTSESHQRGATS